MKSLLYTFLISTTLLASCNGQTEGVQTVDPKAFSELIQKDAQAQILDVRTPEEFNEGHLPLAKLADWHQPEVFEAQTANLDKSRPVYVYCMAGSRSQKASAKLREMGFTTIYDMKGGIVKWNADGLSKDDPSAARKGMSLADYESLTRSSEKVLVDFYATWCAPCRKMAPFIEKMKKEQLGVTILTIDADKNKDLLKDLKISELPTFIFYDKGASQWTHQGFISEEDLRTRLK